MIIIKPILLFPIYPYTLLFFQLESYKESPRLTMQMEMPEAGKVTSPTSNSTSCAFVLAFRLAIN